MGCAFTPAFCFSPSSSMCSKLQIQSEMDSAHFLETLAGNFMDVVQYNGDNRAFEVRNDKYYSLVAREAGEERHSLCGAGAAQELTWCLLGQWQAVMRRVADSRTSIGRIINLQCLTGRGPEEPRGS